MKATKNFLLGIFLFSAVCFGQAQSDSPPQSQTALPSYTLRTITVSGSKQHAESDIIKATGLKIGSKVTRDDLNQAGNRLAQSGVFAQVSYTFDGRTADYVVADSDQLVAATFENFIWFSDAELIRRVHDSVPLFAGGLPQTGDFADQIAAALDAILKDKNIPGHVVVAPFPDTGVASAMRFRIEGVNVKVARIDFSGASPSHLPLLQAATKDALSASYLQSSIPTWIQKKVQAAYGKLGFLKVQFQTPKVTIVSDDAAAPAVALEFALQEGPQFTCAGVDWSGNTVVPTADLVKLIDMKPGGPADTSQLAAAIATAKDLYGSKGYMYAQIKSTATIDAEKQTAALHLTISEGPLYHMGKLELQNLDPQQSELVRKVWEMKEGDAYDSNYAKTFLKKHPHELPALNGWAALYTQTIHDDTQIVDLSLTFQKLQEAGR